MDRADDLAAQIEGAWWGNFEIPEGSQAKWRVGPLTLWIQRRSEEWRVLASSDKDHLQDGVEVENPTSSPEPEEGEVLRVAGARLEKSLAFRPALADRAVINRPEEPVYLLAGDEVGLYVSTPLWLRVSSGDKGRLIFDLPTRRPSDTWFGPNTQEGELCYASKTSACLTLEEVPLRKARAITEVVIQNSSSERLRIERLNLPVPQLSLFADKRGYLWTETVTIELDHGGPSANAKLSKKPPSQLEGTVLVSGARSGGFGKVLVRAFSALLG